MSPTSTSSSSPPPPLSAAPILYFDVDGCLVDSRRPILESLNHAFGLHGLDQITVDDLHHHVGPPLQVAIAEILAAHGRHGDDPAPVIASYRAVYGRLSVELAATYDGVEAALDRLAADGHRLAVVTSKPIEFAGPILDALAFSPRFEVMEGPSLTEAEPKTVTLGRAIAATSPENGAVMIGDRRHDVEAAAAHGIGSIGVTWGFGDRDELTEAGADTVVDHPSELDAAVRGLEGLHRR